MQAIAIAIGKNGIDFFAQHYLGGTLINTLGKLTPPDRSIPVPDFGWVESPDSQWGYSNISVNLSGGTLRNFSPAYQSVQQGVTDDSNKTPIFTLTFKANDFSADYNWTENYNWSHYWKTWMGRIPTTHHQTGSSSTPLDYQPGFGSLSASVVVQFLYSTANNNWEITVNSASAQTADLQANIPSSSILQTQDNSCAGSHVSDATASAIDAIDFATPISTLITGMIASIASSGNLGGGIVYDFSLGDSGLSFPNNDGIQMGVKGGASYNGTSFSGDAAPSVPMPAPIADSDSHHLNMYVSNYEVDALNWAYYNAGKLNLNITPQDLTDPSVLDVSQYTSMEPTLAPYSAFVMNAEITQNSAPVTSFQTAYVFTKTVMTYLQSKLPSDVYKLIQALPSNAFLTKASLDAFLTNATVPAQYFTTIEQAGQVAAMTLAQDIKFVLTIQNNASPQPTIEFSVNRTDVLTNLGLGTSANNTQTMQFGFANADNTVTYIGSSIPGFNGAIFQEFTWNVIGENNYANTLADLGATGVPLPIMEGFQFDFTNAELSVQQGYVSILANVLYK